MHSPLGMVHTTIMAHHHGPTTMAQCSCAHNWCCSGSIVATCLWSQLCCTHKLVLVFLQAEIEHFVNPDDKNHPRFQEVADLEPLLYSR
jgi:hypothetical protein